MQPVIWRVQYNDGSQVSEFDDKGKETVFTEVLQKKGDFAYIALIDTINKFTYSIDLKTGEFVLNGMPINWGKEIDGNTYNFTNMPIKYNEGVIQYKCSNPVVLGQKNSQVTAATYNIGYKVEIPDFKYPRFTKPHPTMYQIMYFQPMVSLNARTMKPTITLTMTAKVTTHDGKEKMIKL